MSDQTSKPEAVLSRQLAGVLNDPERDYKIHPVRKWTVDFAWPEVKLLVEVEGGFGKSRHRTISVVYKTVKDANGQKVRIRAGIRDGFENDCEKYNELGMLGWLVIRVTPRMIRDGRALEVIKVAYSVLAAALL